MREKSNLPLILVAVVAAGLLLGGVCVCFGVVAYFMPAPATQTLPTRDEMRAKLMGKTPQEVIALIGRPATTEDNRDGTPRFWVYYNPTWNTVTQKVDPSMAIWFDDGKIVRVDF